MSLHDALIIFGVPICIPFILLLGAQPYQPPTAPPRQYKEKDNDNFLPLRDPKQEKEITNE